MNVDAQDTSFLPSWGVEWENSKSFQRCCRILNGWLFTPFAWTAVMPSNHLILCHPFPSSLQSFPESRSFPVSWLIPSGGQNIGTSASASVLPMNIQDLFPLGLTGLISLQSKGLSRVFSSTQFKNINSLALKLLHGPTITSVHDYWKNHSFDQTDHCRQNNDSSF